MFEISDLERKGIMKIEETCFKCIKIIMLGQDT